MRRFLIGLVVVVALAAGAVWYLIGRLEYTKLTDARAHAFWASAANVGVLVTNEGVVIVDTMTFVRQGNAIRARSADLTPQPIVPVLNTHYHRDHTHGNPAFPVGTKVVSTARTLEYLRSRDADFWKERPAQDLLPNETSPRRQRDAPRRQDHPRVPAGSRHTTATWSSSSSRIACSIRATSSSTGTIRTSTSKPAARLREWPKTLDASARPPFDVVIPATDRRHRARRSSASASS
jgi:hypothetical protein